jgi:hypothetical protein
MRRSHHYLAILFTLALLPIWTLSGQAHEEHRPKVTVLAEGTIESFPDLAGGPAELWLVRFEYAPGASTPPGASLGVDVIYVEAGTLTVESDRPLVHAGSSHATPAAATTTASLAAGEAVLVTYGAQVSTRNDGAETASILMLFAYPAALEQVGEGEAEPDPTAVSPVPSIFAVGVASTLPDAPLSIRLEAVTIPAGISASHEISGGAAVGLLETGSMTVALKHGQGFALPSGFPIEGSPLDHEMEAELPVQLSTGGYYSIEGGSRVVVRNQGEGKATMLRAVIEPVAVEATPAA